MANNVSKILLEGRAHANRYLAFRGINRWIASLSVEERKALRTYSYMGMRINRLIAEQAKSGASLDGISLCADTLLNTVMSSLDSAIGKCRTRFRTTVFRGLPAEIQLLYNDLVEGEVISIPTYLSASEDEKIGIEYARSANQHQCQTTKPLRVYMRISIPANSCAAPLGAGPFEAWTNVHEVVLPRNSQFVFLTSEEEPDDLRRICMALK